MKRFVILFSFTLVIIFSVIVYSQFLKNDVFFAVLLHEIDLNNPPEIISAITTNNQKLQSGWNISKGTRFTGKLSKENEKLVIYFDSIQALDGKNEKISCKSNLNIKAEGKIEGISAKLGKTLHQHSKSNVLGAIFKSSSQPHEFAASLLPRGLLLKIEIE